MSRARPTRVSGREVEGRRVDPRMARPVLVTNGTSLRRRRKSEVLEAAGVLIGVMFGFLVLAALIALVMRWFE